MKRSTLLRKTSLSVYLKDVAQTKSISLLYPDFVLTWNHPIEAEELLLLDTSANPMNYLKHYYWMEEIKKVYCLPGMSKGMSRILNREVEEVS